MAWEHLSVTKPHLVYIILGGFTSLFMLCSSVIKERLYIGEATVATLCGIIFGPHAANLINPIEWGNSDLITLEFSRIVLVVQCFAVGVELPKSYMERHWKSVVFLLVPVMTWSWLVTSLFIWWMFNDRIDWLDGLCIAACVTATDPVLASSVVGKGKFARRIPKHLRDILSAESGCNDGMAFPFVYLAIYLIRYRPDANKVAFHWFCYTVLYECIFGAFYGVVVGYLARRAIKYAHEKDLIDRESFLVFYFVLALFCAGSGSLLGMDDLLVGFACGVGFSNDGWFQEKTEEAHVSNVIDLLINLAFFVYFGAVIPWNQFNSDIIGTTPWRLVVIAVLVLFFRRLPIMMALKPAIPDIKTWREALFAGHFGPIGVGGIFVAILARAELETEETTPLAVLPEPGFPHLNIIELIWPITVFLVITSIIVHGSSIAVFTLGKRINTLTLTVSFTQANEEGPSWMERLPRIQSRSKSQLSIRKPDETDSSVDEKMEYPPGTLPPVGFPGLLRRQKEEDTPARMISSPKPVRKKKWDSGLGPGGPISESAIHPQSSRENSDAISPIKGEDPDFYSSSGVDTSSSRTAKDTQQDEPEEEVFKEGDKTIFEDEEGNVLEVRDSKGQTRKERSKDVEKEARKLMKEKDIEHGVAQKEHPGSAFQGHKPDDEAAGHHSGGWNRIRKRMQSIGGLMRGEHEESPPQAPEPAPKRGAARAYQFGNTIIVEDEDGEVLKKYDIPAPQRPALDRKGSVFDGVKTKQRLQRMGNMLGIGHEEAAAVAEGSATPSQIRKRQDSDDEHIRFTMTAGGRRMSKIEFIQQIQRLDPKARAALVEDSNAPEAVKEEARKEAKEAEEAKRSAVTKAHGRDDSTQRAEVHRVASHEDRPKGDDNLTLVESNREVPFHSVSNDLAQYSFGSSSKETAAERRRRLAALRQPETMPEEHSEDEGPTAARRIPKTRMDEGETAAERRRREGALGISKEDEESSSDEEDVTGMGMREPKPHRPRQSQPQQQEQEQEQQAETPRAPGIRFAEQSRPVRDPPPQSQPQDPGQTSPQIGGRLRWGENVKK